MWLKRAAVLVVAGCGVGVGAYNPYGHEIELAMAPVVSQRRARARVGRAVRACRATAAATPWCRGGCRCGTADGHMLLRMFVPVRVIIWRRPLGWCLTTDRGVRAAAPDAQPDHHAGVR